MSELRHCHDGGYVVSGKNRIPEDLCEYQHPHVAALIGCNRLKCGRCGDWVRHGPPGRVAKDDVRPRLAEAYEAASWSELPYLKTESTRSYRLYVCRCSAWAGRRDYLMHDPDPSPFSQPILPWFCAGHEVPTFPLELGHGEHAMEISSQADAETLANRILDGWCPRRIDIKDKDGPAQWLAWMYAYLLGLPEADAFSRACAAQLADTDDVVTVGRILYLFRWFPQADGIGKVVDMAIAHPKRVCVGYPVPEAQWSYWTVLDVLTARLAQGHSTPKDAIYTHAVHIIQQVLLTPRRKLSRKPARGFDLVGAYEKALRKRHRFKRDALQVAVDRFEKSGRGRLLEKPATMLEDLAGTAAFDEDELRWLAFHIVDLEKAWKNRWQGVLRVLARADATRSEELGHLVVVAGVAIVQSGLVDLHALRKWLDTAGRSHEPWALPIIIAIDKEEAA